MNNDLSAKYDPKIVEEKWYNYWMDHKFFASKPDGREPYTIVMPPPNVTGILHMGHMLNNTLQDVLVRRARMTGKNACWVPGTDHASIATEAKVVNRLAQRGIAKKDLTREEFLEHAWDWTHEHGGVIMEQLKKIGASCDWDRTAFTLDEVRSESVIKVFVDLYNKGLIYRGVRMVNWDPKALTALSDEEVIHKEEDGKLYYLRYRVEDQEDEYIVVATTRPETIFGDTAVCVHPDDIRYQWLKGRKVIVPIVGRAVPIIQDEYVDKEFGTGCLKVTPSHDINDYMLGQKYNLPAIEVFYDNGTLNENGGKYKGKDRFVVRNEIVGELAQRDLLEKVEDYHNSVGYSERTDVPIEPKLSTQWFVRMEELAKPAYEAVRNGEVKLVPPKFNATYAYWMENIKDWCISRQLWWGHRIPAYFLPDGSYVVAETREKALQLARKQTGKDLLDSDLEQDPDCLDTWFSSWLWPISVWGDIFDSGNKDLQYYYPTSDLVSGPDILFFWVARMIIAGYEYRGCKPFEHVYLTGIVRDSQGRKMSKQLGNSPDPLLLIEAYGADGVRMGLMTAASAGNDILFDESLCEQGRNFNNKIWNSFRLIQGWTVDPDMEADDGSKVAQEWFEELLMCVQNELDDLFSKYRISEAMKLIYRFVRDDFSGTYLELVKPAYGAPIDKATWQNTLTYFDTLLRLLHPFMPFITEELWQAMEDRQEGETLMLEQLPSSVRKPRLEVLRLMEQAKEIVTLVRNIRVSKGISTRDPLPLYVGKEGISPKVEAVVRKMAFVSEVKEECIEGSSVVSFMVGTQTFSIPLEGLIDAEEEKKKLQEQLSYYEQFLSSVRAKLSNPQFVERAPEKVVSLEKKKEADALEKISQIERQLNAL